MSLLCTVALNFLMVKLLNTFLFFLAQLDLNHGLRFDTSGYVFGVCKYFSLELKQSKTPPATWSWIILTLMRRYVFSIQDSARHGIAPIKMSSGQASTLAHQRHNQTHPTKDVSNKLVWRLQPNLHCS